MLINLMNFHYAVIDMFIINNNTYDASFFLSVFFCTFNRQVLLARLNKSRKSDELTSGDCGLTPLPIIESKFKKNVTRRDKRNG